MPLWATVVLVTKMDHQRVRAIAVGKYPATSDFMSFISEEGEISYEDVLNYTVLSAEGSFIIQG